MRIVAGSMKGRAIDAPNGTNTRPTTDRVREALFSSLFSMLGDFDGLTVLDAFAGSGALGLEAASRGAAHVVFFENDRDSARVIRRNAEACKLDAKHATIVQRDVFKSASSTGHVFDLVFLDPPYACDASEVAALVAQLAKAGALAPQAIAVYEHAHNDSAKVATAIEEAGFVQIAARKYGKTGIAMFKEAL